MDVDGRHFLEVTREALKQGDASRLAAAVQHYWTPAMICPLLRSCDPDVRRVAAVVLGLIGDNAVTRCLTEALQDEDAKVNQMAEHALWAIWFRSGSHEACKPFQQGVDLLADDSFEDAAAAFAEAIELDPHFAEAHHQRAIAFFFLERWQDSVDESALALEQIPNHFGAMAGVGHCYAHLGDLEEASKWYAKALDVNPRMPTIRRALASLNAESNSPASRRIPDRPS